MFQINKRKRVNAIAVIYLIPSIVRSVVLLKMVNVIIGIGQILI